MKVVKKCWKICCLMMLILGAVTIGGAGARQATSAGVETMTVTKIDQATAKKLHKKLMAGKKFQIRIKADWNARDGYKEFYKKFQKLTKKTAKCTDVGLDVFMICANGTSYCGVTSSKLAAAGGYTTMTITKEDCEEYIWGIKYARREYKKFKKNLEKSAEEMLAFASDRITKLRIESPENAEKIKQIQAAADSIDGLMEYLDQTKFRDLSGAMKARVTLHVRPYMKYAYKGSVTTFKAIYRSKAYGHCSDFARVTCKMCAVYGIGEGAYFINFNHGITQVRMMTMGGEYRYITTSNGEFFNGNTWGPEFKYTRDPFMYITFYSKIPAYMKKMHQGKQLKRTYLEMNLRSLAEACNFGDESWLLDYNFPRSEW